MRHLVNLLLAGALAGLAGNAHAQSLSPDVYGAAGGTGSTGGMSLDWTLGETMVTTLDNGLLVLTQGFHQPGGVLTSQLPAPFITTWNTANPGTSSATQITIPVTGSGYLYDVDWNDDGVYDQFGLTGTVTHDFGASGTYTIRITGAFPRIHFNNGGDRQKLLSVNQWGAVQWSSFANAFYGCSNMNVLATDAPDLSLVTDLSGCFRGCASLTADLDTWDVLGVTNMANLFQGCTTFNGNITTWATDSVTNMTSLFGQASTFNQPIGGWVTSNVTSMVGTFFGASSFNQPIGNWDVGQVQLFSNMFNQASSFNQPLNGWDVDQATSMIGMFNNAQSFNQPLDQWQLGSVTLLNMFFNATSFDQDLGDWDISGVVSFSGMFSGGGLSTANYDALLIGWSTLDPGETQIPTNKAFNAGSSQYCLGATGRNLLTSTYGWTITDAGPDPSCAPFVTTWKTDNTGTSGPTQITIPTYPGGTYNYDVDWNNDGVFDDMGVTGDITHDYGVAGTYTVRVRGIFPRIYFNTGGDKLKLLAVTQWGDIQWTSMEHAFWGCTNMDVLATDTPDLSQVTDMNRCFSDCSSLTADLDGWNVLGVTDMGALFRNCTVFNGDVTTWQTDSVTFMTSMFEGASSFDRPIGTWDVGKVTMMNNMFREATSFNQPIGSWDVGQVTSMRFMFDGASSFDQPIGGWDVGQVNSMDHMFQNASLFNQPLGSWTVGQVTNMVGMFQGASSFDQPIGGWSVGQVGDMGSMFRDATSFNQPIGAWDVSSAFSMSGMFRGAVSFDQDLGGWDISSVQFMSDMFLGAGLSTANYDSLLIGWSTLDPGETQIPTNKTFNAGSSQYCMGAAGRNLLITTYGWTISDAGFDPACPSPHFVTTWKTDNPGASGPTEITIPTNPSGTYNYDVDWNNDGVFDDLGITGNITHTYGAPGTYTVRIGGTFPQIQFPDPDTLASDAPKLIAIVQWGTNQWESMARAFAGCTNLTSTTVVPDVPDLSGVTDMSEMFAGCSLFTGANMNMGSWNVSQVTNMSRMFANASAFEEPVGGWDVSQVTDMSGMFNGASDFNQPIGGWDVGQVTNMAEMFRQIPGFNQPIGTWDVSQVTDMSRMFEDALSFDQPIGGWNVGQVQNMARMFNRAADFNQPLATWNVGQVTNMEYMFAEANVFNQPIGGWNVAQVQNMSGMFSGAQSFDQPLGGWNVGQVTSMLAMFSSATSFNQPIGGWDVGQVTNMAEMFAGASSFNQPIGGWNTGQVTNMRNMFEGATAFDQDLSTWDVGQVSNMWGMFQGATSFNQPIGGWDVSSVQSMVQMFSGAIAFDQDLGAWDISNADQIYDMFLGAGLSTANYDALLIGWSTLDPGETQIPQFVGFNAGSSMYCLGEIARNSLTGTYGWTITDAGLDPICGVPMQLALRVFLQGPYDSSFGLMNDDLRADGVIPLAQPYTLQFPHIGFPDEVVDPALLATTGNDAIVDWVYLQLRDKNDNTALVATRNALVQRDGDVVDTDGLSPVSFAVSADDYYVAVYHRNHLGALTLAPVAFGSGATVVDLTNGSTPTYGTDAQAVIEGTRALWAGDVFSDGVIKYTGAENDRDPILVNIGGTVPTNITNGYYGEDVNLDGEVKYTGFANDRDIILVNIGGVVPTAIRNEQMP